VWRTVPNMNVRAIYADSTAPKKSAEERVTPLNYFRCISAVDDCLGRLLATLDELGLAENTVVVYASDNGYYHGEHNLGDKRSAYDEALRIPFLVRYPKRFAKGKLVDEMVLNIDLAPTFLELAGVPAPREMQGRSWVALADGKKPEWRHAFFYEYFLEAQFPGTPTMLAVRTETAKLIKYPGHDDWTEVFDLKADPYELKNLARDPARAALRKELEAEFERQQRAVDFRRPPEPKEPIPKKNKKAKAKGN